MPGKIAPPKFGAEPSLALAIFDASGGFPDLVGTDLAETEKRREARRRLGGGRLPMGVIAVGVVVNKCSQLLVTTGFRRIPDLMPSFGPVRRSWQKVEALKAPELDS